jgi:MoaA/NifB/PqqE/SkfB family radical SAM enzyme
MMDNKGNGSHQPQAGPGALSPAQKKKKVQRKKFLSIALRSAAWAAPVLARVGFLRKALVRAMKKNLLVSSLGFAEEGRRPARIIEDRMEITMAIFETINRALARNSLSKSVIQRVIKNFAHDVILKKGDPTVRAKFIETYGVRPPEIILVSPTKFCNLNCKGCYADSTAINEKLSWPVLDHLVSDVTNLWGSRFVAFSGGEPLAYRDQGMGVLDLAERYPNVFFMMYTNGTLIDDETAKRMAKLGNVMPAISIEGMKASTDGRRGEGVFDRIVAAMDRLRREKVLFGLSITASRSNVEEVLSDEVIDFYFNKMGAHFAWLFQYMPIGRAITLDHLPTPEQRLWMWKRSWELIRKRRLYVTDFWNGGTTALGCIGAGRQGGYMAVVWNGDVVPCVFMPYSPVNINQIYAEGKNLIDVWQAPFFKKIREWQEGYGYGKEYERRSEIKNWMMPCPIRDHYAEFRPILDEFHPKPLDENAAAAMTDPEYSKGIIAYNKAVADLMDPIWKETYMDPDYKIDPKGGA